MKYSVTVSAGAKRNECKMVLGGFRIWTTKLARDGQANEATCRLLADHLGIAYSNVVIVRGHTSKQKVLEVR